MTSHKPGDIYFGEYVRFSTSDKKVGAALAGPDNAVGDIGTIEFVLDDSKRQVAWLKNPYGQLVGFLNNHDSYNAAVMAAKGWELHYVLSFTAYSEEPEPGEYWGQVALIAFAPRYTEEFNVFLKAFAKAAGDGLRPDPKLSNDSIVSVLANPAEWKPSSKIKSRARRTHCNLERPSQRARLHARRRSFQKGRLLHRKLGLYSSGCHARGLGAP